MIILNEGYDDFDKFLKTVFAQAVFGGTCLLFIYRISTLNFSSKVFALSVVTIILCLTESFWIAGNIKSFINSFFKKHLKNTIKLNCYAIDKKKPLYSQLWKLDKVLSIEIIFVSVCIFALNVTLIICAFFSMQQLANTLHIS